MNISELVAILKLQLGGSKVNLEITDEEIELLVKVAFIKACEYSNYTEIKEVQALSCQAFEATAVIRVFNNSLSYPMSGDKDDIFSMMAMSNKSLFGDNIRNLIVSKAYSNFTQSAIERSYNYSMGKLYLFNYTGVVTVEYIPKNMSIENLEPTLQDWVLRYTKVLCKEALGRIRGKFKSQSSPFEVDSDQLLGEWDSERQALIDELSTEGFFFIDTD